MSEISNLADRRRIQELEAEVAKLREQLDLTTRRAEAAQQDALRVIVDRCYDHDVADLMILGRGNGHLVSVDTRDGKHRAFSGVLMTCLEQALPAVSPRGRAS